MSILNDHQIRGLCQVPFAKVAFAYRELLYKGGGQGMTSLKPLYVPHGKTYQEAVELLPELIRAESKYVPGLSEAIDPADAMNWRREYFQLLDETEYLARVGMSLPFMISPFVPHQVRTRSVLKHPATDGIENDVYEEEKIISYGLSSFGYDLRLGHKFKVFTNTFATTADPKNFDTKSFVEVLIEEIGGWIIIPPNSFILGYSLERIHMPDDVVGVVLGKSTIARVGIDCLATPLEPGWEGHVTLEFTNNTPLPAKLYVGEGCCQVMFYRGERPRVTYGDRGGKYQNQGADAVTAKV